MTVITPLIEPKIKEWLIKSMESEMYSANLYRHLANQLQRLGYDGAKKYYLKESLDELSQYQKLFGYLCDMGETCMMVAVPAIVNPITSIGDAFDIQYQNELMLMRQYEAFYEEAEDMEDSVTATFLIELLQNQRESVGDTGDLISRLNINRGTMYDMDVFLGNK